MQNIVWLTLVLFSGFAFAQNQAVYSSDADKLVTVRTITVLPVFDNLRGIYSRPIETFLADTLNNMHKFESTPTNVAGSIVTPDELEQNSEIRTRIADGLNSDAFIATSIIKGPGGISIKMSLFLKGDRKLLAQEQLSGYKSFDLDSVMRQSEELLKKLLKKLPYSGLVMSRQGTRITVNLGRKDGLAEDQVISVIQLIKLIRHPSFDFLVSTEKEVIGKIKILKVDETLSFGRIVTEIEAGAIQVNSKLANLDQISYSNTNSLNEVKDEEESLPLQPTGQVNFGENPIAWLPQRKPTFGMAGVRLGFGQFRESVSATGNVLETSAAVYPLIYLEGELWLTQVWTMHAKMKQGIITTDNPVSGGSPSELSRSLSGYEFLFGYNLRLSAAANSAKVEGIFGFGNYRLSADVSDPAGLTTKAYSGMKFGVAGSYPIGPSSPYSVGANLHFLFNAGLKETPNTSGADDSTVNSFGFFVDKEMAINLRGRIALDFELYASNFSGGLASSSSQKHTALSCGIYYLF